MLCLSGDVAIYDQMIDFVKGWDEFEFLFTIVSCIKSDLIKGLELEL
jgi:hypothetical protein